jgi:hypothetical protein
MFKKLHPHIFAVVVFGFLFFFSANQASAYYLVINCVGGRIYVSTVDGHNVSTEATEYSCNWGAIVIRNPELVPDTLIDRSETGKKYLTALKNSSPKGLKHIDVADKINAEMLKVALDPKTEALSYKPGAFPKHIEKLFIENAARVNLTITIYFGRGMCDPGWGICKIERTKTAAKTASTNPTVEAAGVYDGKQMTVFFRNGLPVSRANLGTLPIDQDIRLSAEDARAMGAKSVTILKGVYKILEMAGMQIVTVDLRKE